MIVAVCVVQVLLVIATARDPLYAGDQALRWIAGSAWLVSGAGLLLVSSARDGFGRGVLYLGVAGLVVLVSSLGRPALLMDGLIPHERLKGPIGAEVRRQCRRRQVSFLALSLVAVAGVMGATA